MRVLVIAAHPDDETLGAGGAIINHVRDGDEVTVHILTDGVTSHHGETEPQREAARHACDILGVKDLRHDKLRDEMLDGPALLETIRVIEEVMDDVQPDIVYTHHRGDSNQDHRTIFDATIVAVRPKPDSTIRRVLCYEVPSSTEWGAPYPEWAFQPNVYVNIEDALEQKLEAFSAYGETFRSEVMLYPHPRSLEVVRILAQYRGANVGLRAAECFTLVREVNR